MSAAATRPGALGSGSILAGALLLALAGRAYAPGTEPPRKLVAHRGEVWALAFAPDGASLASGGRDGILNVWDLLNGKPRWRSPPLGGEINSLAYSPDGRKLATASDDGRIRIWEARAGTLARTLDGHRAAVSAVAWSPEGKTLVSGSYDRTVRLWDPRKGALQATLTEPGAEVWSVVFLDGGKSIAAGGADRCVRLWDVRHPRKPRLLHVLAGQEGDVWSLAASPRPPHLAAGTWGGTLSLWALQQDASSPALLVSATTAGPQVWAAAFGPGGRLLATGSGVLGQSGALEIWDSLSGARLWCHEAGAASVSAVAFSPDARTLAAALEDGAIGLWNLDDLPLGPRPPDLDSGPAISSASPPPALYVGVGIALLAADGAPVVDSVIPRSPADLAGLLRGDRLLRIGGSGVVGLSLEDLSSRLRGEPGTSVDLTVGRPGGPLSLSLIRAPVVLPSPTPVP